MFQEHPGRWGGGGGGGGAGRLIHGFQTRDMILDRAVYVTLKSLSGLYEMWGPTKQINYGDWGGGGGQDPQPPGSAPVKQNV